MIKSLIGQLLRVLVLILVVIAVIVGLGLGGLFLLPAAAIKLGYAAYLWSALALLTVAAVVDPEGTKEDLSNATEVLTDLAQGAGEAAGSFVSGVLDGVGVVNAILLGFAGYTIYSVVTDKDNDE